VKYAKLDRDEVKHLLEQYYAANPKKLATTLGIQQEDGGDTEPDNDSGAEAGRDQDE
jgi:hypothetical protein